MQGSTRGRSSTCLFLFCYAFAALLPMASAKTDRIGLVTGRQRDEETLLSELLHDGAPDTLMHADEVLRPFDLPLEGDADHVLSGWKSETTNQLAG